MHARTWWRRRASWRTALALGCALSLLCLGPPLVAHASAPAVTTIGANDWPMFGHDPTHTFAGSTSLDAKSVHALAPAGFFRTTDAVTASPIVVNGTAYFGSWDGKFHALDVATMTERWNFTLKPQPAIHPASGGRTFTDPATLADDATSDGGLVTGSAYFVPGGGTTGRPDEVIFGGGYTLYGLDATTGAELFAVDYPGTGPRGVADPNTDQTRIFSSPVVVGQQIIFGVTPDGQSNKRGYVVAANVNNGLPAWVFETDVDSHGVVQNDGCGGVWSSPTVDGPDNQVIFGVADCNNLGNWDAGPGPDPNVEPYNERVIALSLATGRPNWVFTPPRLKPGAGSEPACDFDFGATANIAVLGGTRLVGIGGKDGTYYAIKPATGELAWARNVVFGGVAGGFVASTAYDATNARIVGSTALGDVGGQPCEPTNPLDSPVQEPSIHAFAGDGTIAWEGVQAASLGPTATAGGFVFTVDSFRQTLSIRDGASGVVIEELPLPADSDGGPVVAGDLVLVPIGSPQQAVPSGLMVFAPGGPLGL